MKSDTGLVFGSGSFCNLATRAEKISDVIRGKHGGGISHLGGRYQVGGVQSMAKPCKSFAAFLTERRDVGGNVIDEEAENARLGGDIKKLRRHRRTKCWRFQSGFGFTAVLALPSLAALVSFHGVQVWELC